LAEVAQFFGLQVQTVKQWRVEPVPLPGVPGKFNLSDAVKWYVAKANARAGSGLSEELKATEIRLKAAQAKQKELEIAQTEGGLVPLADVELWAATALIEAREMIMQLPEMLAASAPPELKNFVRSETDRRCRDTLTALKRKLDSEVVAQDPAE